ncbi:hypothetical protein DealDRAFT_2982 [Dethiobacter alkaliphilus AHT 1]|uniref:YD repeat protein n=2 Tax=Dethiobacter TaxID=427925 RepID=C0GKH3_DETAL|nr:hypothetical protein DealDRAFT_2982 [Dethiobacter alkaliphilus AHT 1]
MQACYTWGARFYDPATGVFLQKDPFKGYLDDPTTLHPYMYTRNDPVNKIDPSGLFWGEIKGAGQRIVQGLQNVASTVTKRAGEAVQTAKETYQSLTQTVKKGVATAESKLRQSSQKAASRGRDLVRAAADRGTQALESGRTFVDNINRDRIEAGISKAMTGGIYTAIGVVAVGVAASVLTGGAATPLLVAAIAGTSQLLVKAIAVTTIGTGAYTAATGVSDMWEAGQDVGYGLSGSSGHSVNLIKDKVFKGNEGAYRTSQFVAATVSTAGTAYLGQIAQGLQATNSGGGATAGVKEGTPNFGWNMKRGGDVINGRKYSGHALERMAPNTLEVRAELHTRAVQRAKAVGLKPGSKEYSDFINKHIDPRGVPPIVVEDAIRNTTMVPGKDAGTFVHQNSNVNVIVNSAGDVITVIPK